MSNIINTPKDTTYTAKNPHTASTTRGLMGFSPSFTGSSALGCTSCTTSRWPYFHISSQRTTFMPPEVDPAQPPMNVDNMRITGSAPGQREKFSVKNPELVC